MSLSVRIAPSNCCSASMECGMVSAASTCTPVGLIVEISFIFVPLLLSGSPSKPDPRGAKCISLLINRESMHLQDIGIRPGVTSIYGQTDSALWWGGHVQPGE